ncbi:hotdog fold domain-containing protein [Corynebacterium evansiae]|uniref:hotdog fold domain-containing protein n=2 Tax=Corynebacterium TaxID=1716 RepID=UPI003EB99E53
MSIYDANANPSSTFKMYKNLAKKPFGNGLFSLAVSAKAPYFLTVQPRLQELRPGYCQVKSKKWWLLNNHIGTFHAIAACNVAEFAMGMLAEASIPNTHRWLPQGMRTKYLKKTKGSLTATATAELPDFEKITKESGGQTVTVTIHFADDEGKESTYAEIDIWVTAKK